jgi:hypothetical protein
MSTPDPTPNERDARRGFLRQLSALLAEGVPPDVLIPKIESWAEEQSDRWGVISEHLGVIYDNAVEGSEIPEEILDEDGADRRRRESDKIVRSTIERLMVEVTRQQRKGRDVPPDDRGGG